MDALNITLLDAEGRALEMTSNDLTWITDWTGLNFPIEVREGEMLVVEAVTAEAQAAFWEQYEGAKAPIDLGYYQRGRVAAHVAARIRNRADVAEAVRSVY